MNLPRKDKNGNSYLSYSQINTFKRSKKDFIETYILNKPFEGNAYTDFGSLIGEALEVGDFNNFNDIEKGILNKCVRLDEFEKRCILKFDEFYLIGFIDTISNDLKTIIDYKTGGKNKHYQYSKEDYTQLCYYALAIRQEFGVTPEKAYVNFISRGGNAFRGEDLYLDCSLDPKLIEVDISIERLTKVYYDTIEIAKEIELFCNEYNRL